MLVCVNLALRQCPELESFECSSRTISNFFGPSPSLSLCEVCRSGTVAALDWIWAASCTRVKDRSPGWMLTNYLRSDQHYHRWKFAKSLLVAVERGDVAIVEWLFAHFFGCGVSGEKLLAAAANRAHLRVDRFLWERRSETLVGNSQESTMFDNALKGPRADQRPCTVRVQNTYTARSWGHTVIKRAIENGQFTQCLNDGTQFEGDDQKVAIAHALTLGDYALAELLLPSGKCFADYAPWCPPPEMIKEMLRFEHFRWDEDRISDVVASLAATGRLDLMQQLFQLFSPLTEDHACWKKAWRNSLQTACDHGKLLVLQWLMKHPLGYEEVHSLKYECTQLRAQLVDSAATRGHVDVMEYLLGQGVLKEGGVSFDTIDRISKDQFKSVKWLLDHELLEGESQLSYAVTSAARYGRLDILQLFETLDSPARDGVVGLKRKRTGEQYLIWGSNKKAHYMAAEGGQIAVLEWLQENYPKKCGVHAIEAASSGGHLDTVKLLHTNKTNVCTKLLATDTLRW